MKPKFYNINRKQWAERKLTQYYKNSPNIIVSDIGAGFGWFGSKVENLKLQWQPFDYIQKIPETIIWDLNNPSPKNVSKAGFVIFLEVLEHLANPELGIKNIANHIKKGGYIALSTPNPCHSKSKLTLLLKGYLYTFQPKHLKEHHVFVPWPHIVQFYLENHGFEILEYATIQKYSFPKFRFHYNYLKGIIKYLLEKFLEIIDAKAKGVTQVFFAKKVN